MTQLTTRLFLGACIGTLVACGGGGTDGQTTPASTETPAAEPVAADDTATDDTAMADDTAAAPAADPGPQIEKGASVWADACAMCHGDDGAGKKKSPGVVGDGTLAAYADGGALLEYIKADMPKDDPGGLDAADYEAVTAWIISQRGVTLSGPIEAASASSVSLN